MKQLENVLTFGGEQQVWKHSSEILGCDMNFAVYLPPQAAEEPCPVLYWLSGLTCSEQNFITKAGAQKYAAKHGIVIVAPDTSPRGEEVANDEAYDLGQGAGFYINSTQEPWSQHYKMFDYVTEELPTLVESHFPVTAKRSISGHSMGGHGAMICALKKEGYYQSVSAFAPICAPSQVPWGEKVFSHYLGDDEQAWKVWDSCALLEERTKPFSPLLVDQGDKDTFLETQLQPEKLKAVADENGHPLTLRMQAGYDHSYYFIASFIEDHFAFHAKYLK